jgi:hypothetical protein
MLGRGLASVSLIAASLACSPADRECFRESEEVQPEERVRGYVLLDLLQDYFGRYEGTLTWKDGVSSAYSLDLRREPGAPFVVYDTYDCEPRNVLYWSPARVATADGAFDNETNVTVSARFPDASPSLAPDSVASFSVLPDWAWNDTLRSRLPVDGSRYSSGGLLFTLEWPPDDQAPTSGQLDFSGVLASAPNLGDSIRVASITFSGPP